MFYAGSLAFLGGVTLASLFSALAWPLALLAALLACFLLVYYRFVKVSSHAGLLFLILLALAVGLLRMSFASQPDRTLAAFVGQSVALKGFVVDEPSIKKSRSATLEVHTLSFEEQNFSVRTRVRLSADLYPEFDYGDEIIAVGTIEKPGTLPGGFDYGAYLAKDNIYYQMYRPQVEVVSKGKGSVIMRALFSLKGGALALINRNLPKDHADLLGGMLVGGTSALDAELASLFRVAGIIHIVVLSGYNISIVARSIVRLFFFVPKVVAQVMSVIGIIAFVAMAGASATIIRAALMSMLALFAERTGREYRVTRALVLTAVLMIFHNPKILLFDPSFQLSFLATLGLIYGVPVVNLWLRGIRKGVVREAAATTIATQLFVLPLLLYYTGELSLVSLPVNLLVVPLVPLVMAAGLLLVLVGFVPLLGALVSFAAYGLLAYVFFVAEWFAAIPYASILLPISSLWLVAPLYLLYWYWYKKLKTRLLVRVPAASQLERASFVTPD
ncbi:MAG: ComEC/Rec2 family competence protein [bacterium]|nr:ComEC/Rec2 family competence protein [bacterium]